MVTEFPDIKIYISVIVKFPMDIHKITIIPQMHHSLLKLSLILILIIYAGKSRWLLFYVFSLHSLSTFSDS